MISSLFFLKRNFTTRHYLGPLVAGNFFLAEFDKTVPTTMRQVNFHEIAPVTPNAPLSHMAGGAEYLANKID